MELLLRTQDRGYPADYLLSRVRGKRAGLISDWHNVGSGGVSREFPVSSFHRGFVGASAPKGLWFDLMREYRRLYLIMNEAYLKLFRPFFLYSELRTIFICLRHITAGTASRAAGILSASLLSDDMKKVLGEGVEISVAVGTVEKAFLELSGTFAGIARVYYQEGPAGFERELTQRYLVMAAANGRHPLLKEFFVRVIDSRNIISLYKFIRLNPRQAPVFIPGGDMSKPQFSAIAEVKDIHALSKITGIKDEEETQANVEMMLYKTMTEFTRKAGRDPLGAGPVLDYLWRCSIEIMNLGMLWYGRDLRREEIEKELVD